MLQTVAETPTFRRRAEKLLTASEHEQLIEYLAANPTAGQEIPGTGGVRKLRFSAKSKGKRGGVRVIYFFYRLACPIYALLIYGKDEQMDLSPEQKREVAAFAKAMKTALRHHS